MPVFTSGIPVELSVEKNVLYKEAENIICGKRKEEFYVLT